MQRPRPTHFLNDKMRIKSQFLFLVILFFLTLSFSSAFTSSPRTGLSTTVLVSARKNTFYNKPSLSTLYMLESTDSETTYTKNKEAIQNTSMNNKIKKLLKDDDFELVKLDQTKEASDEIADLALYSKISEETQRKASSVLKKQHITVKEVPKRRMRVKASVKETGGDSMKEYVKSMGSHELLPQDSEILLGKHIQSLVKYEQVRSALEDTWKRPPTFGEWSQELQLSVPELKMQIRKSQRAKAALIEANLRLVVTVARQTVKSKSDINFMDACQEGVVGLSIAAEKFDPEKGFRFSTYAVWWIRREVQKNVQTQTQTVRLPASAMKKINDIRINERLLMTTLGRKPMEEEVAKKCNISLEKLQFYKKAAQDVTSLDKQLTSKAGKGSAAAGGEQNGKTLESLIKDAGPTPETIAEKEMLQTDVRRLIKTLSPREQAVIRLRFGLDDGTPRTLDYIAQKFSVDKERIRKVEAKALLKLRQPYRNQSVKCYISDL